MLFPAPRHINGTAAVDNSNGNADTPGPPHYKFAVARVVPNSKPYTGNAANVTNDIPFVLQGNSFRSRIKVQLQFAAALYGDTFFMLL